MIWYGVGHIHYPISSFQVKSLTTIRPNTSRWWPFCKILCLQFLERNCNGVAENIVNRRPLSLEGMWPFYAIWPILLLRMHSKTRQVVYFKVHLTPQFFFAQSNLLVIQSNWAQIFEFARILDFLCPLKVALEVLHNQVLGKQRINSEV